MKIAPISLSQRKNISTKKNSKLNFTSGSIISRVSYSDRFEMFIKKQLGEKMFFELLSEMSSEKDFCGCHFDIIKTLPQEAENINDKGKIIFYCLPKIDNYKELEPIEISAYNLNASFFDENDIAKEIFNSFTNKKEKEILIKEIKNGIEAKKRHLPKKQRY